MSARATLLALLLVCGASASLPAPRPDIPPNQLPGHERERFIDPFPPPPRSEPVIVLPKKAKPRRTCHDRRSSKRRKC